MTEIGMALSQERFRHSRAGIIGDVTELGVYDFRRSYERVTRKRPRDI